MNCLYRYIIKSLNWQQFSHGAELKSQIIYRLLQDYCDDITLVRWIDRHYQPGKTYDVVFDIRYLNRLTDAFHDKTIKILYLNASEDVGRNKAELDRVNEVNKRRGSELVPHRQITDPQAVHESIELADLVILTGNEATKRTYPEQYWDKMILVNTITTSEVK